MSYEFFLTEKLLPIGFKYPETYVNHVEEVKLHNSKVLDLVPWHFYSNSDDIVFHFKGLKDRYPQRSIVPFVRRWDTDDVACFKADTPSHNPPVIIIHDWAGPGYEGRKEYSDFSEWLDIVMFLNQRL